MDTVFEQDMTGLKEAVADVTGYSLLHIELDGISHNYPSNTYFGVHASDDGGATWSQIMKLGPNFNGGQFLNRLGVLHQSNGQGYFRSSIDPIVTPPPSTSPAPTMYEYQLEFDGPIDTLKFVINGNRTFDAGTVRVFGDILP